MESSDYLYHFTDDKEVLKSIVDNGLWVQYSCEDASFLQSLSDEIDWDRVWDEMMVFEDEDGESKQELREPHNDSEDRYKIYIPMVCFCDIPHTRIHNHAGDDESTDYGPYAIVFEKEWGKQRGLNPVCYTAPESNFSAAFQNFEALTEDADLSHADWQIRSVFRNVLQFLKPYEDEDKRYYDEREWRYIPSGEPRLYPKSEFEATEVEDPLPLSISLADIECLVVNHESEVEDMNTFLRHDLNADVHAIQVRTFEKVQEHGIE